MGLKEKINSELLSAMKGGDGNVVSTLRFLLSVIKNKELEKRTKLSKPEDLSEEEIITTVLGEIKKRKESAMQYEKGGRANLAEKEKLEIEILKKYVPEEMPESELRILVKSKIASIENASMKDFGKIMGLIKAEVKSRASGEAIKNIVEEELKQTDEK